MGGYVLWWGRKDAFPGADGGTIQQTGIPNATTIPIYGTDGNPLTEGSATGFQMVDITAGGIVGKENTTLVYAIQHPLSCIYNTGDSRDWYTQDESYLNNTLWGEGTVKSNYDPCPQGWRVPADKTWGDYVLSTTQYYSMGVPGAEVRHQTNGRVYASLTWYPACGNRNRESGLISSVGYSTAFWEITPLGVWGRGVYFDMTTINPNTSGSRANGMVVRCVQE